MKPWKTVTGVAGRTALSHSAVPPWRVTDAGAVRVALWTAALAQGWDALGGRQTASETRVEGSQGRKAEGRGLWLLRLEAEAGTPQRTVAVVVVVVVVVRG